MNSEKTSPKELERLYVLHLERYVGRLEQAQAGHPNFNKEELVELIGLWVGVRNKDFDYTRLTDEERYEVNDAIYDEEE